MQKKAEDRIKAELLKLPTQLTGQNPELEFFLKSQYSDETFNKELELVSLNKRRRNKQSIQGNLSVNKKSSIFDVEEDDDDEDDTIDRTSSLAMESKVSPSSVGARRKECLKMCAIMDEKIINTLLDNMLSWDFDVFQVQEVAGNNALSFVGYGLLSEHATSTATRSSLRCFLQEIQGGYINTNPYHNALHGADVAQTMAHFIYSCGLGQLISHTMRFASILAALAHDVGHLGVNNLFLVATKHRLALLYNDKSPLENMHANFVFEVMKEEKSNVLETFTPDQALGIRRTMIEMILATDNARHTKYLNILNQKLEKGEMFNEASSTDDQITLLRVALHAADVSNPAKMPLIYKKWTDRIVEEFFRQGDQERALNLVVSAMNDREKPIPEAKFQIGFISAIVLPLYVSFAKIPGMNIEHCVKQLTENLNKWKATV
jgi:hypothetical protein